MRKDKPETREEKIYRWIGNLNRGLAQYPELRSLRERKAEREAQLRAMPLEKRLELVPPEETEREWKELIATYTEIIVDVEKELAAKQQAVREVKAQIAEFRRSRAKLERQTSYV
jgi:LmbE family N-acetylglucosaminyl deacetylase